MLKNAIAAAAIAAGTIAAAGTVPPEVPAAAREVHEILWKRYILPDGTMLDYTNRQGEFFLPTPEECDANKPNGLGWWTPIENGSFFGGLYLDALCTHYAVTNSPAVAERARKIAAGLYKLGSCGKPGFIARGFADDGKTHYPASSDDQSYPWFLGMWRYLSSPIPQKEEKEKLLALFVRNAEAFREMGWRIPTDREGYGFFGAWDGDHFDANVRRLFIIKAAADLTGKPEWEELYRRNRDWKLADGRSRLDICAGGSHYQEPTKTPIYPKRPPIWTSASSQAGLLALSHLDREAGERYRGALKINAERAFEHLLLHRRFQKSEADQLAFSVDWRSLNDPANGWKPQASVQEAIKLGIIQYGPWKKVSPRRIYENDYIRDPLFAAWVIFLSGDEETIAKARPEFYAAMANYPWEELHSVCFFLAESAFHQDALNRKTGN